MTKGDRGSYGIQDYGKSADYNIYLGIFSICYMYNIHPVGQCRYMKLDIIWGFPQMGDPQ